MSALSSVDSSDTDAHSVSDEAQDGSPEYASLPTGYTSEDGNVSDAPTEPIITTRKRPAEEDERVCKRCTLEAENKVARFECSLCKESYVNDVQVVACECNGGHPMHLSCFLRLVQDYFDKQGGHTLPCPLCRSDVEYATVTGFYQLNHAELRPPGLNTITMDVNFKEAHGLLQLLSRRIDERPIMRLPDIFSNYELHPRRMIPRSADVILDFFKSLRVDPHDLYMVVKEYRQRLQEQRRQLFEEKWQLEENLQSNLSQLKFIE